MWRPAPTARCDSTADAEAGDASCSAKESRLEATRDGMKRSAYVKLDAAEGGGERAEEASVGDFQSSVRTEEVVSGVEGARAVGGATAEEEAEAGLARSGEVNSERARL